MIPGGPMSSGSSQTTVGTMTPVEDLMIDAFLTPGGPMSFGSLKTLVIRRRPFQSNNQPWSAQLRSRQKGTSRRYVPHSWRTSAISLFLVKNSIRQINEAATAAFAASLVFRSIGFPCTPRVVGGRPRFTRHVSGLNVSYFFPQVDCTA